ncbi:hypothetical protein LOZ61_006653 [Ophidiomyces ophidiicola]|uniref:Uncharacterized protein n=1 Tax=Ophidiomyces ophidiicola TaxID=1387563 RepID=A0ACB8UNR6_9EURO|nr:hypothetical protein LOZ61_006653 [Ophidiomyces ophidiicola]KAI1925587.1 hypothetical protein LOZ60_004103 [Ophidiomyces ophidiicola]KAI1926885.1 hypothetical protein LOZ64_000015 [Ophidiomyces ophidiicola]KAI1948178.1 hypothetical protein LOZ59_006429 [Ophidiomyces ophidiicola]KAI1965702.1 hypothetical protein LOZ56_005990 [Ophidiomyces ophidiicola]
MAFTLGETHNFVKFVVFGVPLSAKLPYEVVVRYLPSILHLIDPRISSRRSPTIDLTTIIRQTDLPSVIPWRLYCCCLDRLLKSLSELYWSPFVTSHIMTRLMGEIVEETWGRSLKYFACYQNILGRDCLNMPRELRDDLSDYILDVLPRIARNAPLAVSLNFVKLLENRRFNEGMSVLWSSLPSRKLSELILSDGQIDLALSRQPSSRIMQFVIEQSPETEEDFGSFDLGQMWHRHDPFDSDDGFVHGWRRGGGRRRRRHGWEGFTWDLRPQATLR